MRNRPEMELMCRLLRQKARGSRLAIAVLACSKGAEVYSILWCIRTARPDLKITMQAVDISSEIVDFAREGTYSLKDPADLKTPDYRAITEEEKLVCMTYRDQGSDQRASIFERLNESELEAMFDIEGDQAKVKSWLKEGIVWRVGDASDQGFVRALGSQDVVVANRFFMSYGTCSGGKMSAEYCGRG